MEPGRLSRRGAGALRRMPHAAQPRLRARQPQEIRRRADRRLARLQHQLGQGHRRRRLERRGSRLLSVDRTCDRSRHRFGPDGRSGRRELQPAGAGRHPRAWWPICAACRAIASPDLPATLAPPAPASHKDGGGTADAARQDGVRRRLRQLPRLDRRKPDLAVRHADRRLGGQRSRRDQCRPDRDFRHQAA